MSGALNQVFGGGLVGAALNVASMAFPPLAIANAVSNVLTQVIGQAVGEAAQGLAQNFGMPKFIAQEIGELVKKVVDQMQKQTEPGCEEHVKNESGGAFDDFKSDFVKDLINNGVENMKGSDKKKGAGSWYEALAQALGQALDKQAANIEKLSGEMTDANAKDKPSTMTELQTASQRMSFMMSAADQVLKTLGEALSTMARKQ